MPTEKCGTKTNQLINDSDDDVDIYTRGWEKAGKTSFNEDLGEFIKFYPNIFVDCQ